MSRMDPDSSHRDIYNRYSVVVFAWPARDKKTPHSCYRVLIGIERL
jgi:hypothetical protein